MTFISGDSELVPMNLEENIFLYIHGHVSMYACHTIDACINPLRPSAILKGRWTKISILK